MPLNQSYYKYLSPSSFSLLINFVGDYGEEKHMELGC